ncbi:nitroreductase family protein [Ruminococcus flavefaciens]|uniref:nitroreductase family protein n=1 Tax=Ruminococcus flavefaciens TaxID=1265 RepID=UPI0026E9A21D|nr:nitroreductase family protein [Ruminococcus flavefaciens]
MDFYEAVNKRSSIRDFTDEAIPEETIKRIIGAAYKAPTNDHFRDWHFIVVTDKAIMAEVLSEVPKDLTVKDVDNMTFISDPVQKESYQVAVPKQYSMLINAAAVIIPLMKKKVDILHPADLSHLNCFASVWCSIENLWLAATAEGYGCNLRIPWGNEEEAARKAAGFPEEYMIPCFIGIGRPAENAKRTKQLVPDMGKQLHWQKF